MHRNRSRQWIAAAVFVLTSALLLARATDAAPQGAASTPRAPSPPPATSTDSLLPGGATSVQETFGDWTVRCVQREGKKVCSMSQQLLDKEGRRVAAVELTPEASDSATGIMLLPFGLAVDREVTLEFPTRAASTLRFRTCIQAGCLVDLKLDGKTVANFKQEASMVVKTTADGGQPFSFNVSLSGFGHALDRTAVLLR